MRERTTSTVGTGEVDARGFSDGTTSAGTLSATPDNSGNLWTANTDGSVTQLLGLATPTANPIYPGVRNHAVESRVLDEASV